MTAILPNSALSLTMRSAALLILLSLTINNVSSWQTPPSQLTTTTFRSSSVTTHHATDLKQKSETQITDETTEKYGLEAGLFQSMKEKDGGKSAKELLKKYGVAYLATSIPLALVSFAICYTLVNNGVDVQGLLTKVGIETDFGEKVGTVAIAYAAHKAASPIRFPPTVFLTPVVAKLIGKEVNEDDV